MPGIKHFRDTVSPRVRMGIRIMSTDLGCQRQDKSRTRAWEHWWRQRGDKDMILDILSTYAKHYDSHGTQVVDGYISSRWISMHHGVWMSKHAALPRDLRMS